MQTILGTGGVIATETAKHLRSWEKHLRLVSREPKALAEGDELVSADLLDTQSVMEAVKGSEVVYLTVGIQYNTDAWQANWPKIMTNVINACKEYQAKLVYFDNVYMYGQVNGPMTETTPYRPCSKKGEVKGRVATQLLDEVKQNNLTALIARSADFYGPNTSNTFIYPMVFQALKAGKKATWLGQANLAHSFTYTPDAGRAVAILGNTPSAVNRVWHLPTAQPALTGEQMISKIAQVLSVTPKYGTLSKMMLQLAGLFNSMAKESSEMMYQYTKPYIFDSSDFNQRFFQPTTYDEGIKQTIATL